MTPPQIIHYGPERDQQLIVQISHRVTHNPPEDTQGWIDFLCHDMIDETIRKVTASSKDSLGKSWEPVWIPYHDGVNSTAPLSFFTNSLTSRQDRSQGKGLSLTHGRALLDRANFSNWDTDGTQAVRNCNANAIFMLNVTEEDVNSFRQLFQENLMAFHIKAQVCKSKLHSYPEPLRVVHVMYYDNNIQPNDFIKNVLKVIEKVNGSKI